MLDGIKKLSKVVEAECLGEAEFYRSFVLPQSPVIIRNTVKEWPALSKWNLEFLDREFGDVNLSVKKSDSFRHPDINSANPARVEEKKFSEYLNETFYSNKVTERCLLYASGDENIFYSEGGFKESPFKVLMDDFTIPYSFVENRLSQSSFWISVKGIFSWLHFDGNCHHNLNAQVKGSKRFLLIHPDQAHLLHNFSVRETVPGFNFSKIDLSDIDYDRFPEAKNLIIHEAILEEGDLLFIPSTWYHSVEHLGEVNINVNFWWEPEFYPNNSVFIRSKMLNVLGEAFLKDAAKDEVPPKWENWMAKNQSIAELIFKSDEYLLKKSGGV